MLDLAATMEQVQEIARSVGRMQVANLGRKDLAVAVKSTAIDLVTEIDKESEREIVAFLSRQFPDHAILAEESGRSAAASDYLWIIDPLDGTTNYSQGLPVFAVSIALQHRGETVLGVVYATALGQMFTAIRGGGSQLNGERIHVSVKQELVESVLGTGFPYDIASHPANNIDYFGRIVPKARAIRRMGAAAYDLACVAAGKLDGFWELRLAPWDVAAGVLLVREAGMTVVDFRQDRRISLIAANETLCRKIQAEIRAVDCRK